MKRSLRAFPATLTLVVLSAPFAWAQKHSAPSVLVTGKVVIDDGSPVPSGTAIQKVCGGSVQSVAQADIGGVFRFQLGGGSSSLMTDATEAGGRQTPLPRDAGPLGSDPFGNGMINCELRARLAGYRSSTVDLSRAGGSDTFDVGAIVMHRLNDGEGNSISATSLQAPKNAVKAYENGMQSLAKNKPDEAAKDFEKAVALYPKYAEAWITLGKLRERQKAMGPAKDAFLKAIEADPNLVFPGMELGFFAAEQHQWEESVRYLDHALKLDPIGYPEAWYADAVADYNLKLYDAAAASVREYIRLNPKNLNPRAHYLLAVTLIQKQDRAAGIAELKNYIEIDPHAPDIATLKEQLEQLEKQP